MTKITALPLDSAPQPEDYIPTVDSTDTTTKKTTLSTLTPMDNPYKFSVYMSTNQTLTSASTFYTVNFNTEHYDTNSNFDTTTYIYTAPVAGFYLFGGTVLLLSQAGAPFLTSFAVNGTSETMRFGEIPNTTGNVMNNGSRLIQLSANDTVRIIARCDTAGKILSSGTNTSHFWGFLVSRT